MTQSAGTTASGTSVAGGSEIVWEHVSLLWATQLHAQPIAALHATMFPEGWSENSIAGMLAHPGSIALVASHGNPPAVGGFALAQVAADEAEVLTLGVLPDWRRHKIGSRLVDGIKRAAARAGARSLFLEVAASNQSAQALYKQAGFLEVARRQGYYKRGNGTAEDAVVLRLKLEDGAAA